MDMQRVIRELQQRISGEVRFDDMTRWLYSTDASIYQIVPLGVVIPQTVDDVIATVEVAAEHNVPILPRGSGTSLGGQTVGKAIVLDFSKYMNHILELNADEGWVRVQPGVVLDELNAALRPQGLMFAPDVATSNRASLGGMVGNNSSGAHSLLYGKTVDHVRAVEVVLADGTRVMLGDQSSHAALPAARIADGLRRIVAENRDEIMTRFPKILRRVAGYNLEWFLPLEDRRAFARGRLQPLVDEFNLAKILVGSEGTLATTVEATLNLVPVPKRTALCVVHFDDLYESLEATPLCLDCEPSAVELTDKFILDLTRGNRVHARQRAFLQGDPAAILIVEFYGASQAELKEKICNLKSVMQNARLGYAFYDAYDPADQARVWNVRKAGLGLLMGMKGDAKPQGFIEDTAVAPEYLADYIRRLDRIIRAHGCQAVYYAHASVGCLHVRPILSLKSRDGVETMRALCEQACDLVLTYGGSFSSEHGDGLVRSAFIERAYGRQIVAAFQQVKRLFDPQGIMNPGKIVHPPPMTENLRYGAHDRPVNVRTYFDFSADGGILGTVELCSGVGECRKKTGGVMCPSYRATREEAHTTRGRANALRRMLSGELPPEQMWGDDVYEVLDLCLECKACKAECPSNVDMAKLKAEFLAHYYEQHGTPRRARFFAHVASLSQLGCALAPLANYLLNTPPSRALLEKLLGIDRRRPLPPFAKQTFPQWFTFHVSRLAHPASRPTVVLLDDTFMRYNEPHIGIAAVRVLEAFGHRVALAGLPCCGRPMISKGLLHDAQQLAAHNIYQLMFFIRQGIPIVGCEPSCLSAIQDDYRDLVGGEAAQQVAEHTFMLEEFLTTSSPDPPIPQPPPKAPPRRALLHGHCHQKALGSTSATLALLRWAGYEVTEIPSGCCGMAGSFGYEKEHYDLSLQIGELSLFPAVRAASPETIIVAPGTSCRHQIAHATGRAVKHPIEVVAEALEVAERENP
ncbi:MAG: FAD-binding protein [Abditibacteriales bacterium]|nr:FAD-binding protein [Abditibacteriales bacterium]MDW8364941.1 FAD-linked oxidase C-terminal domain-containing protein [Abditibacteriales bacterium]